MSLHAAYLLPDRDEPADGDGISTGRGWKNWADWVLTHADQFPEAAHLAQEGWVEGGAQLAELEEELVRLMHEAPDTDRSAVTAQVLAALRSRPGASTALLVTDGDQGGGDEDLEESVLREGFTGTVTDSAGHKRHYVDGKPVATPPDGDGGGRGKAPDDAPAAAESHVAELEGQADKVPPGLLARVGGWVAKKYTNLEQEYGRAGAISILVGAVVLAPIPAPGTSFIPIALAKGIKKLAAAVRGGKEKEAALSAEDLLAKAKELLAELYREHGENPPAFDEGKAKAWFAGRLKATGE